MPRELKQLKQPLKHRGKNAPPREQSEALGTLRKSFHGTSWSQVEHRGEKRFHEIPRCFYTEKKKNVEKCGEFSTS